jgi:16S rRNA (guanine(1405)-N(7))-methyltransferase
MEQHASTAERLPIIDTFFQTCLASLAPVHSVIDLACGLNPFAIPWMPLADKFTYIACDIYEDMLGLVNTFFHHMRIQGETMPCNLMNGVPENDAQVVLLLKSIPCLEQIKKPFGARILQLIPVRNILVSYPVHSLGGRRKGMETFYRGHFSQIIQAKPWKVTEFSFETELAFLVQK